MVFYRTMNDSDNEQLGQGSHWEAIGLPVDAHHISTICHWLIPNADVLGAYPSPWTEDPNKDMILYKLKSGSLHFYAMCQACPEEKHLQLKTAYPTGELWSNWIVQVDEVISMYDQIEGMVSGTAESGHPLQWFAPDFPMEADRWRAGGLVKIGLNAIALQIKPFDTETIPINEGDMLEEERQRLRDEGNLEAAEDPDLTIEIDTGEMRTLYSNYHDHHELIGEILEVYPVEYHFDTQKICGWMLDVQCLPSDMTSMNRIPLYVYPASLQDGYTPEKGQLIQGNVWLQGIYRAPATAEEQANWAPACS
jgi:hypothetical protein